MGVSVIICAYTEQRWDALTRAVISATDQTVRPGETIVVVDHCEGLFERAIRELPILADPGLVRIVRNSGPKGLSGARNTGIALARCGVVAFLDDDARAAPDWLESLTAAYRDPQVLGVGGQVIPAWEGGRPAWFPPEFDWVVGCTYRGVRSDAGPVRNFIGANMSFRADTVRSLGGFNSELGRVGKVPLGCEETELCIRAAHDQHGQLIYQPAARVFHLVPRARSTWHYFRSRCYAEGLSKAAVSRLTSSDAALESERSYVREVLPGAVVSALGQAFRGSPSVAMRAPAIVAGTAITAFGYLAGARAHRRQPPAHARRRRPPAHHAVTGPPAPRWPMLAAVGLVAAAMVLWALTLSSHVALARMSDLGLMTVLPVTFWAALGAVTVAFVLAVTAGARTRWLAPLCVAALVLLLHATPTILYGTLRYSWAWKHIAVIDYIQRHGALNLNLSQLSAYQAWPGFFAVNALVDALGGFKSSLSYASWAPPVFEALFAGPLLLIYRRFTSDSRRIWTGIWLFYLGNWIGQDYLSPQAFAYFFYLVIMAVTLRYLLPAPGEAKRSPVSRTATMWVLMVLLIATVATTHQLTPLMVISAFVGLWLFRQHLEKRWILLAVFITLGWILMVARSFLASNLYWIIQSIGHPDANTTGTLVNLSKVTSGQVLVAEVDRLLSAGMWILAAVGMWRRRAQRKLDRRFLLLAVAPLPMIAFNNYGGEMLFRVYFFALPFVAIFGAACFFPRPFSGRSRATLVSLFLVTTLLLAGFTFSYYGKEQMNYFSPAEVQAGQWVSSRAPGGSLIVSVTSNWPYSYQNYDRFQYEWIALDTVSIRLRVAENPATELANMMAYPRRPGAYLVFTPSQTAEVAAMGLMPPGAVDRIEQAVLASPLFRVAYRNQEAIILTLSAGGRSS